VERLEDLDDEERVAARALVDEAREVVARRTRRLQRVGDEFGDVVLPERQELDLLDPRVGRPDPRGPRDRCDAGTSLSRYAPIK
jgi:hypothetical protein